MGAVVDTDGMEMVQEVRGTLTELASKGKRRERKKTDSDWTERTELAIGLTVVYYRHGRIYTTKACGLPAASVLHQVHWSMHT